LEIQDRRCEVLPGVLLEPDAEQSEERFARLHPALEDSSAFLIYVIQDCPPAGEIGFFIMPANEKTKRGAWAVSLKTLLPFRDAWQLLKMDPGD
jgi:hypothetical protein